jgi:predicted RNA binding protein YcfA (HicA-like mRNA interferase family)
MTWGELVRRLHKAGFVERRVGKGNHRKFSHPKTGKEVWVAIHTKKDAGRLADRILRDAGLE